MRQRHDADHSGPINRVSARPQDGRMRVTRSDPPSSNPQTGVQFMLVAVFFINAC